MTLVAPIIQSIGLACVPVDALPSGTAIARKPVAAAVITIRTDTDEQRRATAACMSDARAAEFPLPVLVDAAIIDDAKHVASRADFEALAAEAAARRFFVETRIAMLAVGDNRLDPAATLSVDEGILCDRLGIVRDRTTDPQVAAAWHHARPGAAETVALCHAASRLVLSAHVIALIAADPDPFFSVMLPLQELLFELEDDHPALSAMLKSKPFNRAASFASEYRDWSRHRDSGERVGPWQTFEDGLFHT